MPLTEPAKAKERILELKPFAVTLDIMMPNKDGWSVLAEIKSDPGTRDIPVVICSIIEQEEKGYSLGAADYLLKPILEEDLVRAMERLNPAGEILDVLIIDDDPNDLRLMERVLLSKAVVIDPSLPRAARGWEAVEQQNTTCRSSSIYSCPRWMAFPFLKNCVTTPSLCNIPVLVVSGGGLTDDQLKQLNDFGQQLLDKGNSQGRVNSYRASKRRSIGLYRKPSSQL